MHPAKRKATGGPVRDSDNGGSFPSVFTEGAFLCEGTGLATLSDWGNPFHDDSLFRLQPRIRLFFTNVCRIDVKML